MADKYDLAYLNIDELPVITPASASDYVVIYDVSAGKFGKALASADLTGVTATAAEINAVADVSGRVVTSTTAALTLSAATHGDRIVNYNDADGAITLPNATGSGVRFKVYIGTAATALTIKVAASTDEEFTGGLVGVDDDADAAYAWKAEDDDDTISLNGTATGGKVGDWFEFVDIATGVWLVSGFITQSGGSEATPFSASVSS